MYEVNVFFKVMLKMKYFPTLLTFFFHFLFYHEQILFVFLSYLNVFHNNAVCEMVCVFSVVICKKKISMNILCMFPLRSGEFCTFSTINTKLQFHYRGSLSERPRLFSPQIILEWMRTRGQMMAKEFWTGLLLSPLLSGRK